MTLRWGSFCPFARSYEGETFTLIKLQGWAGGEQHTPPLKPYAFFFFKFSNQ